jgi:hypothetical protein
LLLASDLERFGGHLAKQTAQLIRLYDMYREIQVTLYSNCF